MKNHFYPSHDLEERKEKKNYREIDDPYGQNTDDPDWRSSFSEKCEF